MDRIIVRVLPRAADLGRAPRVALGGAFALLTILLLTTALNAAGIGGAAIEHVFRDDVSSLIYVLVAGLVVVRAVTIAHRRVQWTIFAIGLSSYGLGNILWSFWIGTLPNPPIPSICDVLWLPFCPLAAVALVMLSAVRVRHRAPVATWMDGIIAGAGLSAIGTALTFAPLLATTSGSHAAVIVEMAYPIGDLLLVGVIVGAVAMRGWRLDRGWGAMGVGFILLAIADFMYAIGVSAGTSIPSAVSNLVYVAAVAVMSFSAWQMPPSRPEPRLTSWSVIVVPTGFMLTGLGVLLYDRIDHVSLLSYGLAVVSLVAAIGRMALAFHDVRSLSEARRLAATDDLTSLPNRRQFMGHAEEAIAAVDARGGGLAVLMLDLDNFKQLNDTLGHHAGDTLLQMIGPRLDQGLRSAHIVGRLGGDEFAILVHPAPSPEHVSEIATRALRALRDPFTVHGLALRVTGSIGIASYPGSARDVDELMRHADIAMYQAKAARNGHEFYAHERDTNSRERLALAAELEQALRTDAIEVHFQPKAHADSRRIAGVEALVRWRRPDGRLIPPAEFVSAAEHAGLSRALTDRVVDLALAAVRRWRDEGHDIHVAVNTTVADLLDADFPRQIAAALPRYGLPAEALLLEITESSVLADPERICATLGRFRELGIELSLDDFGTGYSSLTHLKALPVGELKIDRSFVSRMCSETTDAAIVFAMIQLAHTLGIRVVAEGVEDTETWDALRSLHCDLIQGYLLSRPVPAGELTALLTAAPSGTRVTPARAAPAIDLLAPAASGLSDAVVGGPLPGDAPAPVQVALGAPRV